MYLSVEKTVQRGQCDSDRPLFFTSRGRKSEEPNQYTTPRWNETFCLDQLIKYASVKSYCLALDVFHSENVNSFWCYRHWIQWRNVFFWSFCSFQFLSIEHGRPTLSVTYRVANFLSKPGPCAFFNYYFYYYYLFIYFFFFVFLSYLSDTSTAIKCCCCCWGVKATASQIHRCQSPDRPQASGAPAECIKTSRKEHPKKALVSTRGGCSGLRPRLPRFCVKSAGAAEGRAVEACNTGQTNQLSSALWLCTVAPA